MGHSQLSIKKLRAKPQRAETPLGDGLFVITQPSGRKGFCLRYKHPDDGRSRKLTLGPFWDLEPGEAEPDDEPQIGRPLTLAMAKLLATAKRREIARGIDPAAERQSEKQADIAARAEDRDHFERVAESFLNRYARRHQRAGTLGESINLLGYVETADGKLELRNRDPDRKHSRPVTTWPAVRWKGRKIATISRRDIREALDAIVDAGSPAASNSTHSALSKLFAWAVEEDILAASPCLGIKKRVPLVRRDRVLDDAELRLILLAADEVGGPFGHLIKLLALTGARLQEWAGASWDEIDLAGRVFHLPASRSKNGRPHDVPLSPQAIAVLEELAKLRIKGSDWLLSCGAGRKTTEAVAFSGFSKAKIRLDGLVAEIACREAQQAGGDPKAVKPMPAWRLHDLRRTASTGLARLRVPKEVNEKALNHVSGSFSGVGGTYDRHGYQDEVRDALQRWADAVERISQGEPFLPPSNVIELKVAG